jgi:hypothetical protein
VAAYTRIGIVTSPKETAPFQIVCGMSTPLHPQCDRSARLA